VLKNSWPDVPRDIVTMEIEVGSSWLAVRVHVFASESCRVPEYNYFKVNQVMMMTTTMTMIRSMTISSVQMHRVTATVGVEVESSWLAVRVRVRD